MKYRFVSSKKGVEIIRDPDGDNEKLGNAKNMAGAKEKLHHMLNPETKKK